MAKFTFADGSVFEGTVEELAEYARLAGGAEAETAQEIEGPVRVGDTIEITDVFTEYGRKLPHYTVGKRYEVVDTFYGDPTVIDDDGDRTAVMLAKYRIVARKEEAPAPARPSVKVGDHIVFDEGNAYITAGKAYKVVGIDPYDEPTVVDDEGDEITAGDSAPEEYRIITDARELAFAKAGRKLDEFKKRDIVRVDTDHQYAGHTYGDYGYVDRLSEVNAAVVTGNGKKHANWYDFSDVTLIAPAESRVDGE